LFSYWPVLWNATGISSSITLASAAARSVITSAGERCAARAVVKKRRAEVPALGDEYVDDLSVLVHRPIDVPPHPGDLHVGLVNEPPVPRRVPARARRVHTLGGEPLHPPVQGDVIHLDAALGENLLQVSVGQAEAQIPADREQDQVRWEPEPRERRRSLNGRPRTAVALHPATLTDPGRSVNATVPH
jgi:hypothetical protein